MRASKAGFEGFGSPRACTQAPSAMRPAMKAVQLLRCGLRSTTSWIGNVKATATTADASGSTTNIVAANFNSNISPCFAPVKLHIPLPLNLLLEQALWTPKHGNRPVISGVGAETTSNTISAASKLALARRKDKKRDAKNITAMAGIVKKVVFSSPSKTSRYAILVLEITPQTWEVHRQYTALTYSFQGSASETTIASSDEDSTARKHSVAMRPAMKKLPVRKPSSRTYTRQTFVVSPNSKPEQSSDTDAEGAKPAATQSVQQGSIQQLEATMKLCTVVGMLKPAAKEGLQLVAIGEYVDHEYYGKQLNAMSWEEDTSKARAGALDRLVEAGIEQTLATALLDALGPAVTYVLSNSNCAAALERLTQPKLDAARCQAIKSNWDAYQDAAVQRRKEPGANEAFQSLADIEDTWAGLSAIDLVGLRTAFWSALNDHLAAQRQSIALSVTDLCAAQWCGLQLAYQTASGTRKKQTAQMAQGSEVHEALELEVVQKLEFTPLSAEDDLAVTLLNSVAAIRQLVVEGYTRELRVFAQLQGVWVVGVIDGLLYDAASGTVSLTETKTRGQPYMPKPSQIDSARLQVMVYQQLFNAFRSLSLQDMYTYIFHNSSSWVGLDASKQLSQPLVDMCGELFERRNQQHQQQHSVPNGNTGSTSSAGLQKRIEDTINRSEQHHSSSSQPQPVASLTQSPTDLTQVQNPHTSPSKQLPSQPTVVPVVLSQQHVSSQSASPAKQVKRAAGLQSVPTSSPVSSQQEPTSDNNHVNMQSHSGNDHLYRGQNTQSHNGHEASQAQATSHQIHPDISEAGHSQHGNKQGQQQHKVVTLADCIQLLHETLAWLPPAGTHHQIEYLYQQDPTVVIGTEQVEYDDSWCQPRLDASLALWSGRAVPLPVDDSNAWKCGHCDFKDSCKRFNPAHSDSDPHRIASRALSDLKEKLSKQPAPEPATTTA